MIRDFEYFLTAYRYFTSIFVSLGVFLFGYDQGVMSGIITYEALRKPARTHNFLVPQRTDNNSLAVVLFLEIISISRPKQKLGLWLQSSKWEPSHRLLLLAE